ncbi:MAG: Ryanodine receptor Ryr, partial [Pelosinus sp.]|nr:Ryanodine receptor Ryr [Pelosinus sp.]
MSTQTFNIVVTGDICINSLYWITAPQNSNGLNWQTHLNVKSVALPGEALLLAKLVALATKLEIRSPQEPDLNTIPPKDFLRSVAEIDFFPAMPHQETGSKVYRLKRLLGFVGPATGEVKLLPIVNDDANAAIVIVDDENNGFSSNDKFWPLALKTPQKTPLVLYKMGNPKIDSPLWKTLEKNHINRTIVIINSEDLRSTGVNISKGLSWERTAQDFVWQINNSPSLARLANCRHLIVLLGLEGAIYYKNEGVAESHLYFLPYASEGSSFSESQGKMSGLTSCFVAGIAQCIIAGDSNNEELAQSIGEGIRQGIVAAQKYFLEGFGNTMAVFAIPNETIFMKNDCKFICNEHVQDVPIRYSENTDHWYILKDKSSANLAEIAYNIVKKGVEHSLQFIPIAQFGKLQTVDRTEIESYRSIQNLMREYMSTSNTTRPLSIAVFGTPGSGKSFGIT